MKTTENHDTEIVKLDALLSASREEVSRLKRQYKHALKLLKDSEDRQQTAASLSESLAKPMPAKRHRSKTKPQATAIAVWSDLHCEERVRPEEVRGLNEYSLEICEARFREVVERTKRLIEAETGLTKIRRVVIALLGDYISGHIHEELIDSTALPPLEACRWIGHRIRMGIDEIASLGYPVTVVTACGNHGRSTKDRRIAGETDYSYEQNLHHALAMNEKNKRVEWRIGNGYFNVQDLDGFTVRFHHGHAIRGGGGFGGLVPSTNKAIAGWNSSQPVDLDVMGHHHAWTVSRRFVVNGSLIGPSPFGDRLGFPAEPPCQGLLFLDHKHRRLTKAMQVFVD